MDDMFAYRTERRIASRISTRARRERLEKLISRVMAADDPNDFEERPPDRRIALRQPGDERPFQASSEDTEPRVIWLEDVSRTGMRMRSQVSYPVGSTITIHAPDSFELDPVTVRVVRAQMVDPLMPDRGYEYGTEYITQTGLPHAWYLGTRARQ